jgi:hypothetical protein
MQQRTTGVKKCTNCILPATNTSAVSLKVNSIAEVEETVCYFIPNTVYVLLLSINGHFYFHPSTFHSILVHPSVLITSPKSASLEIDQCSVDLSVVTGMWLWFQGIPRSRNMVAIPIQISLDSVHIPFWSHCDFRKKRRGHRKHRSTRLRKRMWTLQKTPLNCYPERCWLDGHSLINTAWGEIWTLGQAIPLWVMDRKSFA